MTKYSVKELAQLAKISVRTLHHYDEIGLLKPAFRSDKGYRFYDRKQLLMLQQILFYKELGFSLRDINTVINDPNFDLIAALHSHKKKLKNQAKNLKRLINTIDKTIEELNKNEIMKDSEIYEGFNPEQVPSIKQEVINRWGDKELKAVEERIRQMGKTGWKETKEKGEEIDQLLADLMDLNPSCDQVQEAIGLHFRHMNLFYEVSKERYLGLGKMYTADERFKNHYEAYRAGLADFIYEGIKVYCETRWAE